MLQGKITKDKTNYLKKTRTPFVTDQREQENRRKMVSQLPMNKRANTVHGI